MRAMLVYESMFGNTRELAEAVADGLRPTVRVDLVEVSQAPTQLDVDVSLLVVGAPTHAFGLSRSQTRQSARDQGAREGTVTVGTRDWLSALTRPAHRPAVAAFDTRVHKPRVPGSAARKAERQLSRRGFSVLRRAESFWVTGTQGPLMEGERERARAWGEQIGLELRNLTGAGP